MKRMISLLFALATLTLAAQTLPEEGKVYTILSKQYPGMYISEEADGTLVVGSLDNARRQFWEFLPAGSDGVWYIRNKVSGNYIQSCNGTNSSASVMHTGTTAVPYYVGVCQSGANKGYLWFSSTDCTGYNDQSTSPHGLNKDGASSNIIIWMAGTSNNGSHWSLVETTYTYEVQPFTPSEAVGKPGILYHMVHEGRYASADLTLSDPAESDPLNWYFVGESNASGGYQIVNATTGTPATASGGGNDRWIVNEDGANAAFYFTSAADATERFTAGGESLFTFKKARSSFARHAQIYDLPCGTLSASVYISVASITGDAATHRLTYPIRTQSGTVKSSTAQTTSPTSWYRLNVLDQAVLRRGRSCELTLKLNKAPIGGEAVYAYFDWNRDGVFETAYSLGAAREMTQEINVPADAVPGPGRMRVRLTYNGLADAEDDVQGQCIDFALQVTEDDEATEFTVTARPNDPTRGATEIVGDTAKATPFGNASFICWKEGHRFAAASQNYRFGTLTHNLNLTAIFAADANDPYGEEVLTGIDRTNTLDVAEAVEISMASREIRVSGGGTVYGLRLYDTDGRLVRHVAADTMSTNGLPAGVYIVKALTAKSTGTAKVSVK